MLGHDAEGAAASVELAGCRPLWPAGAEDDDPRLVVARFTPWHRRACDDYSVRALMTPPDPHHMVDRGTWQREAELPVAELPAALDHDHGDDSVVRARHHLVLDLHSRDPHIGVAARRRQPDSVLDRWRRRGRRRGGR